MQILLSIFAAFFMFNGIIQNGFGIMYAEDPKKALAPLISLFLSGVMGWLIYTYVFNPIGFGEYGIFFLFPVTVLCCVVVDRLSAVIQHTKDNVLDKSVFSGYEGIAFYGAFQTLMFAQSLSQAFLFALGGALGFMFVLMILNGIQKRSEIEGVPMFFKGQPLLLISTGLLSMLFSALVPLVIHLFSR
ncbi:hypothetical protein [Gracilinema caldarium]|uniref:hypothetical protein n=1 Tax=Gracilinema caldarium TaxID=215591 RepID=UPI0026F26116|nr:hypothetical protein [Gracilinema caldarium]